MKAADVAEPDNVDDAGDPDADDGRGARPTMPTKDQLSEPVKLLRDLLERSAEEYSYVTIPDPDADAMFDCPILAFRLFNIGSQSHYGPHVPVRRGQGAAYVVRSAIGNLEF